MPASHQEPELPPFFRLQLRAECATLGCVQRLADLLDRCVQLRGMLIMDKSERSETFLLLLFFVF